MPIKFQITATPLQGGTFQPKITLVQDDGSSKEFTGYTIDQICETREEALEEARKHAKDEAHKRFSSNEEITIEVEE